MNSQAAVDQNIGIGSTSQEARRAGFPNVVARIAAQLRPATRLKSDRSRSGFAPGYRIGEVVHHGRFGAGRVIAQWPDGRLQVKFADSARTRLIFPSFLD
jgi:hypothetical protein